jgi:hypothetical protein
LRRGYSRSTSRPAPSPSGTSSASVEDGRWETRGTRVVGSSSPTVAIALLVGSTYIKPQASLGAIFRALIYLAFWYALAACAFRVVAIETRGRSMEETDDVLAGLKAA